MFTPSWWIFQELETARHDLLNTAADGFISNSTSIPREQYTSKQLSKPIKPGELNYFD